MAALAATLTATLTPAVAADLDEPAVPSDAGASAGWQEHCPTPPPGVHRDHLGAVGNVALTFDDGPHPVYTPIILDLLAKHEVRATFFVVGRRVVEHPELLRRVVDEGHLVANHTFTHPTRPNDMDTIEIPRRIREIDDTTRAIQDVAGVTPCFFRGPQGYHRSPETVALANHRGMLVSGWTISALDALQPVVHDEDYIAEMVERTTTPMRERPVVLWHDSADKPNTPPAVDRSITVYKQQGYGFVDPAGRAISPVADELLERCPARLRFSTRFADVSDGSVHRHAILCAVSRGIASGRDDGTFAPGDALTRGQFAAMLDQVLADRELEVAPAGPFGPTDIAGTTHEQAIARLAEAGVVQGRADGRFAPSAPVSRAQMASMLDRAIAHGLGIELPDGDVRFADVDASSTHAPSIWRLAATGLVSGLDESHYAPQRPVSRAQAASMLMRLEAQAR